MTITLGSSLDLVTIAFTIVCTGVSKPHLRSGQDCAFSLVSLYTSVFVGDDVPPESLVVLPVSHELGASRWDIYRCPATTVISSHSTGSFSFV